MQLLHGWYYHTKKYRVAMTKAEQCKVDLVPGWGNTYDKPQWEKMRKEYHEYCPKSNSKSNNIVFCPQEIIKRKNDKRVQWQNDHLNDYIKSLGGKDVKDEEESRKKKNKKIRGMKKKKMSKSNKIEKFKKTMDKLNNKLNDINNKLDHLNDYIKSLGEKSKKSKPKEKSEEKGKQERIQEEK